MKIKGFIKWTDIALSLRELFSGVKSSLKGHDEKLLELQKQNISLLQQLGYQQQLIEKIQDRVRFIEQSTMRDVKGNPEIGGNNNHQILEKIDDLEANILNKITSTKH